MKNSSGTSIAFDMNKKLIFKKKLSRDNNLR